MNNLSNINNTQQRSTINQARINNNTPTPQAFSGQVATQTYQPQFNVIILQLLMQLIQQLLQLISDQQPDQPHDQTLNPDDTTRAKLADILGVPANTIKVTDRDGNGQLSTGDLVEGTAKDDIGSDVPVSYELTDLALRDIKGELGPELPFSDEIRQPLRDVLGIGSGPQPQFIGKIFDNDGSGKLSAGDVVSFTGSGIPPFSTNYVELTADQVQQLENQAHGPDLTLSQDDLKRLGAIYGRGKNTVGGNPINIVRTFDTDGNGKLSVGDKLEGFVALATDAPQNTFIDTITQDVADRFNRPPLNLPDAELQRLSTFFLGGLGDASATFKVFDTNADSVNGEGVLSAGDLIEIKSTPHVFLPPPGVELPQPEPFVRYVEVTSDVAEHFNNSTLPGIVTGGTGGIRVGFSFQDGLISDDRVVTIKGRNYSIGFLKQQVDGYANSTYSSPPDGAVSSVNGQSAWGGSATSFYVPRFESYVSNTFPAGDPGVPSNPPSRYEDQTLIVDGQAYAPHLNDPQFAGRIDSLIIQHTPENQNAVQQLIDTFPDVNVISDIGNGFTVSVPPAYYGQWQAALMDNLPAGSEVFIPAQDFGIPAR